MTHHVGFSIVRAPDGRLNRVDAPGRSDVQTYNILMWFLQQGRASGVAPKSLAITNYLMCSHRFERYSDRPEKHASQRC